MNRKIVAAIAGGSLALGIVVGAAGAVIVRDTTTPASMPPALTSAMRDMHQAMAGQMGTEMASQMTELMGSGMMGSGMMGSGPMEPGPMYPGSDMEVHRQHHPDWP